MKITKVMVNRKFSLGNFENIDVAAEAELSETDNALDVWTILKDNAEMWFTNQQRKDKTTSLTPPPQTQGIVAAERFTDETLKNILVLPNGDIQTNHFIEDKSLWAKINRELEGKGFVWISAGRESRWSQN